MFERSRNEAAQNQRGSLLEQCKRARENMQNQCKAHGRATAIDPPPPVFVQPIRLCCPMCCAAAVPRVAEAKSASAATLQSRAFQRALEVLGIFGGGAKN